MDVDKQAFKFCPTEKYPELSTNCNAPFGVLILLVVVIATGVLSVFSIQFCTPITFINGVDSWGNVCGGSTHTQNTITGLPGSGDVKSNSPFLWHSELFLQSRNCNSLVGDKEVSLCVAHCAGDIKLGIVEECSNILLENNYLKNKAAVKYCEKLYTTFQSRGCSSNSNTNSSSYFTIINRCSWANQTSGSRNYLTTSMYVVDDVISHFSVLIFTIFLALIANIFGSLAMVKYPGVASCIIAPVMTLSSYCYFVYYICREILMNGSEVFQIKELSNVLEHLFFPIAAFHFAHVLHITYFISTNFKGICQTKNTNSWLPIFYCVRGVPKLLCQPLWTLIYNGFITVYIGIVVIYALNCWHFIASGDGERVEMVQDGDAWWVVACLIVYFYFINIGNNVQDAIVSGAARRWFFDCDNHPITAALTHVCTKNLGLVSLISFLFYRKYLQLVFRVCKNKEKISKWSFHLGYFGTLSPGNSILYKEKVGETVMKNVKISKRRNKIILKSWTIGLPYFILAVFAFVLEYRNVKFPSLLMLLVAVIVFRITVLFSRMFRVLSDAMYMNVVADLHHNNGINRPFYSKRDVLFHITGNKYTATSTVRGRLRYRKLTNLISGIELMPSRTKIRRLKTRLDVPLPPRPTRSQNILAKFSKVKVAPLGPVSQIKPVKPKLVKPKQKKSTDKVTEDIKVSSKKPPLESEDDKIQSTTTTVPEKQAIASPLATFYDDRGLSVAAKFLARTKRKMIQSRQEQVKIIKVVKAPRDYEDTDIFDWYI